MIKADRLKNMVDSCAKVLTKGEADVIGIRVEDGAIEVFGTGQVSAMLMSTPIEGEKKCDDFVGGVAHETISKILGGCGASDIALNCDGNALIITGILNAKIPLQDRTPEIRIETEHSIEVPAEWFRRCCVLTGRFASKEKGRYALNVGHFELTGGAEPTITFAAADGRRIVCSTEKAKNETGHERTDLNIPRECCTVMASALPPGNNVSAYIRMGHSGFKISVQDVTYWCLLQEGEFPLGWREIMPKADTLVPVDGKRLAKFSGVMDALGVERSKFVSDGKGLTIYGKSEKVPEIDTRLDVPLEAQEMILSPALLAGAAFDSPVFHFGWGKQAGSDEYEAAVFVSPPFTAACMAMTAD